MPDQPDVADYNERTSLAWQRTALAMMAGSAVVARLTLDRVGALAVISLVVALPLALWVLLESHGRYAHDAGLRRRPHSRGGRAPAILSLVTVMVGLTELTAVVSGP